MSYITPGGGKMIWVDVIDTIEDVGRPGQYNWEKSALYESNTTI